MLLVLVGEEGTLEDKSIVVLSVMASIAGGSSNTYDDKGQDYIEEPPGQL